MPQNDGCIIVGLTVENKEISGKYKLFNFYYGILNSSLRMNLRCVSIRCIKSWTSSPPSPRWKVVDFFSIFVMVEIWVDIESLASNSNVPDQKISSRGNPKQKVVLEALVARIFASVTAIKAAYAELQMAQNPCNNSAVQAADEAIVEELRTLLELKRKFLKRELDLSPLITLMLAEIQEQQSLMKTYEITIKKLESDVEAEGSEVDSLHKQFKDRLAFNKSLENKLNASGPLSMFDNINNISTLNLSHFLQVLHKALRSVRSFVKLMIKEMELANWDLDAAAKAIESGVVFVKQNHRCLAFESFVCRTMLEGFNLHDFCLGKELKPRKTDPVKHFNEFKALRSANSKLFLARNLDFSFGKFIRAKYLNLVHFRFKCSFFHQEG
ncbi:protein GRAVITROPIC IN THE LIGHT 1-like [Hibiscus syriacus]|uniref:protein GRAVITROPIC IN THE LIGHT 1-like n=1 Tax=Hibiscus syriacus TaxID=106335 RepID=UPI001922A318|nr:protein GRAVITROPIC IN THE LIGHT 1-like [Hibiscus syriacus]